MANKINSKVIRVSPLLALMTSAAFAQSTPPSAASTADDMVEIIVTANRQEQNLQKVSSAVQVVSGAEIQEQGLVNVEQIFSDIPSVQITAQPAGFNIDIRGQAADRPSASAQGSVAVEFDGVYNIQSYATTIGFFDTERIEVLPGPQSTQYGPNAKGGVVNIISKDPVLGSWDGQGTLTVGNYDLYREEFGQNIPIGDTLALRISGAAINRQSYFTPATGNAVAQSIRAKLLYEPTDQLNFRAEYQFDHIGGTGSGSEAGGPPFLASMVGYYNGDSINRTGNPWRQGDYSSGCGAFPPDFNAFNASNSGTCQPDQTHSDIQQNTAVVGAGYKFTAWAALDVTQSYIGESGTQFDCKPETYNFVGSTHNCYLENPLDPFYSYSTEVRLHSVSGNRVLWNVGFYHWNYHVENWTNQFGGSASAKNFAATSTDAIFADVTYPVLDQFRLIAGVRGSDDERWFRENSDPTLTTYHTNYPTHFDYRVGEEFDITPTSMEYFTVSTGYAPGAVGEGVRGDGTSGFYVNPDETLTAFELGSKNRFLDNRLQLNADVYYYIQKNYSFNNAYSNFAVDAGSTAGYFCPFVSYTSPPAAVNCQTPNTTANAHSLGLESQIHFYATSDDLFGANLSGLGAYFNKKQDHPCNTLGLAAGLNTPTSCYIGTNNPTLNAPPPDYQLINGTVEDHSPAFQGTFSYMHTFRFNTGMKLNVGGEAFHSTGFWLIDSYDSDIFYQPSYWQYNSKASVTPADGRWTLTAYVRNISNYAVKVSAVPATTISDPRTFGATLSVRW